MAEHIAAILVVFTNVRVGEGRKDNLNPVVVGRERLPSGIRDNFVLIAVVSLPRFFRVIIIKMP